MHSVTIRSEGQAETTFAFARLKVTTTGFGNTGEEAKRGINETVVRIRQTLFESATRGNLDTKSVEAQYSVAPNEVYLNGNKELRGYRATYTTNVIVQKVEEVASLHDRLTSINGVVAASPVFVLAKSAEVEARAFEDAVTNAQARFTAQCVVLGLEPTDWAVSSWSVETPTPYVGKTLSIDSSDKDFEVGRAIYRVLVELTFHRKTTT